MSQLLATTPAKGTLFFQELVLPYQKPAIGTQVVDALCYVCNKGLEQGCSLTAKVLPEGLALFCEKHYLRN